MALLSSPWHAISSTPPATRSFTAILVILSAAHSYFKYASIDVPYVPYLTLVPVDIFYYPWTLISAGFVETHFFELLLTLLLLPACLRYLERLWGALETLKFITITLTLSNAIALAFSWLEWAITDNRRFIYHMNYHGQTALQTGVLVAFTQLIPEHQVQFFGAFSVRVKRLPMFYVGISNVLCILGYQSPWILIQFGWLVSWTYLRFYKRTIDPLSGIVTYGDRSETFAFIQWFPPFVHKPLSAISNATHDLAIKLNLIRPFSQSGDLESGSYAPLPTTGPGAGRAEAERRRALALKALDQRLASSSGSARANTPTARNGASASTSSPAPAAAALSISASVSASGSGSGSGSGTTATGKPHSPHHTRESPTATAATAAAAAATPAAAPPAQPPQQVVVTPPEPPRKSKEGTVS